VILPDLPSPMGPDLPSPMGIGADGGAKVSLVYAHLRRTHPVAGHTANYYFGFRGSPQIWPHTAQIQRVT